MTYTVSAVAKATGITVRTLHHYDEIGVLHPSGRSPSGYRMYDDADLERLQEILFFRALGFGLNDVRRSLADPDRRETLLRQRQLMVDQAARFHQMVDTIDRALEAIDEGTTMSKEDLFEVFGDFDPDEHAEEARERWGGTDAYQESQRRTKSYGKEQWKEALAEGNTIAEELAALMVGGDAATGAAAMDLAERHRQHITRWFYPCPSEMHVGLGEMYTTDARFTAYWDKYRSGLAVFVRDAFRANAERGR
ncbi:MAG: MerR family transcriptional regulator [Acidimicrobiia bacterium]|nr:MerR family transcriptional regulator [Acidimicrobiia bacterium]